MTSMMMSIPRQIPLLVIDEEVLLPGSSMKIPVTSSRNMAMIKSRLLNQRSLTSTIIGVVPKEPEQHLDISGTAPLHTVGTAAVVVQVTGISWPQPSFTLLVTGLCRFRLEKLVMEVPYLVGVVTQLDKLAVDDEDDDNQELMDLIQSFRVEASKLLEMLDVSNSTVARLKRMLGTLPAHHLADLCASLVNASFIEKLQVLDAVDLSERLKKSLPLLVRQIEGLEMLRKSPNNRTEKHYAIQPKNRVMIIRPQRDTYSRSDHALVPSDDEGDELQELHQKLRAAKLPPHASKVAMKELQRLKKLASMSPESGIIRTYVELMAELPWSKSSPETLDINKARQDLDADHYAMDKLKRRVLEYLAVRQLKNNLRGPILCFVGPPGVGKTSVGRSIAQTLGREFHRISLGGSCNQSDIRGHRRTYIGAMPGRIIQGLKTVGVNNPVMLLDEIDKLSTGIHGDPAAALLEVLDPEQNCNFVDHYLNVPFDLSKVMFIATANTTRTIPPALLDRMELIHVQGYTQEEKLHIASRHLLPKQLEEHGLESHMVQFPMESIKILVSCYTREAGVRTLERKLGALCRAVAVHVAEMNVGDLTKKDNGQTKLPIILDEAAVEDILGPALYSNNELWSRLGQPGVAVGLAWTTVGGEVLLVEANKMEGDGELVLTGHLGDVMKESARLALNWVRTTAREYGLQIDGELLAHTDLHIHFPAGAVGKDGPSAGVTIAAALISLFSERPIDADVAMTGEITLRGVVLPVGGVKEKVLAAHRAGLKQVILPKKNGKDLHEVPENVKKDLTFVLVSHMDEVLQAAFTGGFPTVASPQDMGSVISKL
ncbi:Lon protease-like protein 2, peroxisomal [Cryptotermes secundus]|uniref:Lon protease homolog n=1 Tax=Cryptotermes secundus TaxID=105785 RepID=A0A2J7PSL0_9NEOP|nr:lon protease homolog 2, peroxisomal [Cryptotermes secundus]PNF19295.1 Lon protease-like protein 2, peroxisomal [Cryptotermes secundus]PNF19296.1 Lon protease-like protein 2, peroxisomal [Cryptotermes secundus]